MDDIQQPCEGHPAVFSAGNILYIPPAFKSGLKVRSGPPSVQQFSCRYESAEKSSGKPKMTVFLTSPPTRQWWFYWLHNFFPKVTAAPFTGNSSTPCWATTGYATFVFVHVSCWLVRLFWGLFYYFLWWMINVLNFLGKAQLVCKSFRNSKYQLSLFIRVRPFETVVDWMPSKVLYHRVNLFDTYFMFICTFWGGRFTAVTLLYRF